MSKPSAGFLDGRDRRCLRQRRPAQHDHWKGKLPRRRNLPVCRAAPAVLGNDDGDSIALEECAFVRLVKRATCGEIRRMRDSKRRIDGVHTAHEIMVLGRADEWSELLAAECKEHPARLASKGPHCRHDVRHVDPMVTCSRSPRQPTQRQHGSARLLCRVCRIGGDRGGIWMGCIDQRVDPLGSEVMGKSLRTAEAADPYRDRLRRGRCGTPRKRQGHIKIGPTGEFGCEAPCFRSAAEYQDPPHGRS